jgi:hypothetical protein
MRQNALHHRITANYSLLPAEGPRWPCCFSKSTRSPFSRHLNPVITFFLRGQTGTPFVTKPYKNLLAVLTPCSETRSCMTGCLFMNRSLLLNETGPPRKAGLHRVMRPLKNAPFCPIFRRRRWLWQDTRRQAQILILEIL